ncbi:glycosyltransferase [Candidatus Pelagibacter communis]|uniref:glycosyltransferase n=1 Tax=Candidatus Pelagibacter TaxID=198251 RepID=UPI003EE0D3D9
MKFSIIIPILNEKKNITILINRINYYLKYKNYVYEIIVVDDSSTDGSIETLKKLKKKIKRLKIIFRNKKRDLSQSCKDGFEFSKFDNILVMDGDLQHNPKYIRKMFDNFRDNNYDFVIGARDLLNKRVKSLNIFRQFSSIFLIKILHILFGNSTIDPMSGFFLFKKKIYINNKKRLFLNGFKILADLIYTNKNYKVKDIKIKFDYRVKGKSKLNIRILLILIKFIFIRCLQKINIIR